MVNFVFGFEDFWPLCYYNKSLVLCLQFGVDCLSTQDYPISHVSSLTKTLPQCYSIAHSITPTIPLILFFYSLYSHPSNPINSFLFPIVLISSQVLSYHV